MKDGHARSMAKAISWRALATLTTMIIVYLFTGELVLTLGVGALEIVSKIILYYIHERIWTKVRWGTE